MSDNNISKENKLSSELINYGDEICLNLFIYF
jgi:hypothetical protein